MTDARRIFGKGAETEGRRRNCEPRFTQAMLVCDG